MNIRVLMFGWEFPPHVTGGLGMACYGLTKSLAQANVAVTFVLPKPLARAEEHTFLKIVFPGKSVGTIKMRSVDTLLTPYQSIENYSEYLKRLARTPLHYALSLIDEVRRYGILAREIAEEEEFDVIHAHDWLSFPAGVEAKKVSGKPLIVHVHATEFDRTAGHPNQLIYDEERRGMHEADCIIAVSHRTKGTIVEHYGVHPNKIVVVHNGLDHDEHNKELPEVLHEIKSQGKKIVLFFGRITVQKGPDHFLNVAKRVLDFNKNVVFIVAGTGDMKYQMVRHAADLGISDHVIFTGELWGDDKIKMFRAADLYVMPSVSEPFGITALEAMVNGTPLLVSRQTGAGEVISHALRSDFWDVDDMTDKILAVLESRALKQTLSEFGIKDVKRISWDETAGKCVTVYRDMINKGLTQ